MDSVNPRDARIAELERLLTLALDQVRVLTARVAELERRLGEGGDKPHAAPTSSKHESRAKRSQTGRAARAQGASPRTATSDERH